jgi:hypothetical protein
MKGFLTVLTLVLFAGPSTTYCKYQRPVQVSSAGQHYAVIDETIWAHARNDLADLRLYSGQNELPYTTTVERGALHGDSRDVKIFQQGRVGGKTQFFLDMEGIAEYDHINIRLATTNFVAHARAEGHDTLHGAHWTDLGGTIFYDLSNDSLGHNSTLRLPLTTYRYLRVTIDGLVAPGDIQGASAAVREEEKAVWRNVNATVMMGVKGRDNEFAITVPANVPIERLSFAIDPAQPNFRRTVEIQSVTKKWLGSETQTQTETAELSRIHLVRDGQKVDSEKSDVDLSGTWPATINVVIHNGDDQPLKISEVHLQQLERRIYFNLNAQSSVDSVVLYYGDEKLEGPEYDYAKLFQRDAHAAAAQLGREASNAAYTPRPDDRPWSERHPAVLWIAIIAAVVILGAIALRSMKGIAAQPPSSS